MFSLQLKFAFSQASCIPPFYDVPCDHPFFNEIKWFKERGITKGCTPDGRYFCPNGTVDRQQMATFTIRQLFGENFSYPTTPYFSDVPPNHPFFKYIQKFKEEGLTKGCNPEGTLFCPDNPVDRQQIAVFIIRALYGEDFSYPETPYFNDVPPDHPFFKYIQKFRELGLTKGCTSDGSFFCPDRTLRREEMAAFFYRAFGGSLENGTISAGVTDSNGTVTLVLLGNSFTFQLFDQTSLKPLPNMSVFSNFDNATNLGILFVLDPTKKYPPRFFIIHGQISNQSSIQTYKTQNLKKALFNAQSNYPETVKILLNGEPNTTIGRLVLGNLPPLVEKVDQALGVVNLAIGLFKVINTLGIPLGDYAEKFGIAQQDYLTQEEALNELKEDAKGNINQYAVFFLGKLGLPSLADVTIDLLNLGFDYVTTINCGLPGQKILRTKIDNLFYLYSCKDVPTFDPSNMGLVTANWIGDDPYLTHGIPLTNGTLKLIGISNLGLGFEVNFDTSGKASVEVPIGSYEAYVEMPGYYNKKLDNLTVSTNATVLNISLDPYKENNGTKIFQGPFMIPFSTSFNNPPFIQFQVNCSMQGTITLTITNGTGTLIDPYIGTMAMNGNSQCQASICTLQCTQFDKDGDCIKEEWVCQNESLNDEIDYSENISGTFVQLSSESGILKGYLNTVEDTFYGTLEGYSECFPIIDCITIPTTSIILKRIK